MRSSVLILQTLLCVTWWHVAIDARSISASHNHPSSVKHFEPDLDTTVGYWSPSSSSIDWCERNYVVTRYIAEFWNCLSSFSMCILGGISFVRGLVNNTEMRFLLSSLGLAFVGLGSAYFHGTLTHVGQMADELPMVYSMIVWWFILVRMNEFEPNKSKLCAVDTLVVFGIFYGLLWTYVHSLQAFVLIFQGHISLMVVAGVVRLICLYRQPHHGVRQMKYLLVTYVLLLITAFVCWVMDQQLCERMNRNSWFNPQLHAWWHLLGAVHCHLGIVCGEAMRLLSIRHRRYQAEAVRPFNPDDHLRFAFRLGLPYVDYSKGKRADQTRSD